MDLDLFFRWLREFHLPAVAAASISIAYFWASAPSQSLVRRALASAHGATTALLYSGAWLVYLTHHAKDERAHTFTTLAFVPLGLMIGSFFLFRGNRLTHLLQIPNALCLFWVWLRGVVIVTGFVF
jgi:hypothetical protein